MPAHCVTEVLTKCVGEVSGCEYEGVARAGQTALA